MDPLGWLTFLVELADRADELALSYFRRRELRVDAKADTSPVTEADLAIEAALRERLAERHPELGVFGEEQGETAGRDPDTRLLIDPIDSTRNFMRGIPIFATLLALEERGEVVAGVVTAPALATRWTSARGHGAFEGSRRLRVSRIDRLDDAQLFHGSLAGSEGVAASVGIAPLARATQRQRGFGDFYQHCLVAAGAGEISFDPILEPWDAGPLVLLVEEAGGRATTLAGERSIYGRSLVCSNGVLHTRALELLSSARAAG